MTEEIEVEFEDARKGIKLRLKGATSVVDKYLEKYGYEGAITEAVARTGAAPPSPQPNQTEIVGGIPDKPPHAETLSQYITDLIRGDWGATGRTSRELIDVARTHGISVPMSTLSGILNGLTRSGKLRRLKVPGDKQWHYYPPTSHQLRR